MLLRLTTTYMNGDTKKMVLNADEVREIAPDTRENVPSKSILFRKDGYKLYLLETVDEVLEQMSGK